MRRLENPVSEFVAARSILRIVKQVARRFVAGADLEQALRQVVVLQREGLNATLDLLG